MVNFAVPVAAIRLACKFDEVWAADSKSVFFSSTYGFWDEARVWLFSYENGVENFDVFA